MSLKAIGSVVTEGEKCLIGVQECMSESSQLYSGFGINVDLRYGIRKAMDSKHEPPGILMA